MLQHRHNKIQPKNPRGSGVGEDCLAQDIQWAEDAAAGSRMAFEKIYQAYLNRIYGLCLRLTGDVVEAEQLTQDTFVKAWLAMAGYTGRGPLGGWLARVATNLWRDRYRSRQRRERLASESVLEKSIVPGTEPMAGLSGAARSQPDGVVPLLTGVDLERCIARLPEGARVVYVFHEIEGYTHGEIAEMLVVAVGTVKAQLHRARKLLRVMLTAGNSNGDRPNEGKETAHGAS